LSKRNGAKQFRILIVCCSVIAAALFLLLLIRSIPRDTERISAADTSSPSRGNGSALLSWAPPGIDTNENSISPAAGYNVYVGKDPASLTRWGSVSGLRSTTFEVDGLATPGTYYFAVTAYNRLGTESAKSNIARKTF
jgi:hypothetical protein